MFRRGRRRRNERGAAAVEFALVVPLLLLIFFGIVNFGVIFAQELSLSNAARQAARFAVVDVDGRACGDIETEGRNAVTTIGLEPADPVYAISGATGTCQRPCAGATASTALTVTMTYQSPVLIPVFPFPNNVEVQGKGVFRCEYT